MKSLNASERSSDCHVRLYRYDEVPALPRSESVCDCCGAGRRVLLVHVGDDEPRCPEGDPARSSKPSLHLCRVCEKGEP